VKLLGPEFDLPVGDSKAELFADTLASKIELSETEILAIANLPPLTNELDLLQQVLCKLSMSIEIFL
jgi:hypothetical protein